MKLEQALNELIGKGIIITNLAQEDGAPYSTDPDNYLDTAYRIFCKWRQEIKDFIYNEKIDSNIADFFLEQDSVNELLGLAEYLEDKNKQRELLEKIRIETSKKLEKLRELKKEVKSKEIEKTKELITAIEKLTEHNFLCIYDVAMDIEETLQMTKENVVFIPIIRSIIRFPSLFPAKALNLAYDYGDDRAGALKYLKENNCIENYEFIKGVSSFETKVRVFIERKKFGEFYNHLTEVYERKFSTGAKTKQADKKRNSAGKSSC